MPLNIKPTDALFNRETILEGAKTIAMGVVREALDDLIEGLNEDDEILPTWDEKSVLEKIQYVAGNIIRDLTDDDDEDDGHDDSGY